jgi:hypothetical protein
MKTIALPAMLLLLSAFAWAGSPPNPADYTINVHVSRSRNRGDTQRLDVIISGKKYELQRPFYQAVLALGDYKAKVVQDQHKEAYDSVEEYEFLFPDQKTGSFRMVGESE